MADKQKGTGASGHQEKLRGQGSSSYGNDQKSSTDNRSKQVKDTNNSSGKNSRNINRP